MKLKYSASVLLCTLAVGTAALIAATQEHGLVVHEWGTFTSVQGGDGNLISWKPIVTSELPKFVYDWNHAGLGRFASYAPVQIQGGQAFISKGGMVTLQRMETPVVYFYSDKAMTADLAVQFPKGLITEWFPQAPQIGPSFVPPSKRLTGLDTFIHKCGVSPKVSFVSSFSQKPITNSVIHWSNIRILAPEASANAAASLLTDTSGSHYFAARETDANIIQLDSLSPTNAHAQYEKFLFYRGVASFTTPLRVTMKSDNAVILANTGKEPLSHLFLLDVKEKTGAFIYVERLLPGEEKAVNRPAPNTFLSPADLTKAISAEMSQALIKEGLYPREATAMVNTWKSSWFAEDGTRVIYVLPRAWTDRTLPMTLNPAPRELTRVMVGRAEVLTPGLERNLAQQLDKARTGESAAVAQLHQSAKSLGRFAEPAFYRALSLVKPQPNERVILANQFFSQTQPDFE
jgi:hypothetical protein